MMPLGARWCNARYGEGTLGVYPFKGSQHQGGYMFGEPALPRALARKMAANHRRLFARGRITIKS